MAPDTGALLVAWLVAINVVGAVTAVADKRRARGGAGRVPEAVFHSIALLGGWPGEILAFFAVRHKTRKTRFLLAFGFGIALNVAVVAWWIARPR